MTDEQIVSTKKYLKYGIDCDIFQEPVTSYARTALWAFEEVDRQKAEIEACKHYYDECLKDLKKAHAEIESLKIANEKMYVVNKEQEAEIERLKLNIKEAHIDIKEHMAEIERLKRANKDLANEIYTSTRR